MNSLYTYYNNVQKLTAYRQAKRMQRGSKFGYGNISTYFYSDEISLGVSDFSIEYWGNAYGSGNGSTPILFNNSAFGSSSNPAYFQVYGTKLGQNNLNWVAFCIPSGGDITTDSLNFNYSVPDLSAKFHLVITREGRKVNVYIDNALISSKEQTEIKNIGEFILGVANSSDVGFVRVWNYALSADDVTAHYNNSDPMGYVVPKAMRGLEPVEITGSNSYTWDAETKDYFYAITGKPMYIGKLYRVNITVSNYESGSPFIYTDKNYPIPAQNGTYDIEIRIAYNNSFGIYGGRNDTDRRLTLTVNSVTPVGLIAEYLPQNLMGQKERSLQIISENSYTWDNVTTGAPTLYIRTDPGIKTSVIYKVNLTVSGYSEGEPYLYAGSRVSIPAANGTYDLLVTPSVGYDYISVYGGTNVHLKNLTITVNKVEIANVVTSWLDSAKQLPLSDEYLPPLFQSIGGYDMAANGAPEILYNE